MPQSSRFDSLVLLAHALGRSREWIVAHPEQRVSRMQERAFMSLCERRARGTPVAYLLGSAGFYGREFLVDERVLVPRPETEHLVEEAIRFIQQRGGSCRVLDVGTGSGAIACSIAAETNALVDATDVSHAAIAVAARNAERLAVFDRCQFRHGHLTAPVSKRRYDVVVANLPYVPTADLPQAPEAASFEPRVALDGGSDGLALYRRLLPQLPPLLDATALVLLEAAPPTVEGLDALARLALPGFTTSIGHDYAGLARYVKAAR